MNTVTKSHRQYAGATGVCEIEDISDWPSGVFFDLGSFFGVFELYFSFALDPSFPFDLDLDTDF